MNYIEAFLLGIVQGLTEFLPVSSSGHLEIGKQLFGINAESSFAYSLAVHGATVLSTILVFWKEIVKLLKGALTFTYNNESKYLLKLLVSLIPIVIIGFGFKNKIESLFNGNIKFVGAMLIVTAIILFVGSLIKRSSKDISYIHAFIIGIAQAIAVLPGISRSGATISTGLMLGNTPSQLARFSFLMVLIPVIGANFVELIQGGFSSESDINFGIIFAGFIAAFISGFIACRWMIRIVQKGKLYWFGIYCLVIGSITIIFS